MIIDSEAAAKDWLAGRLGIGHDAMERLEVLAELLLVENSRQNLIAGGTVPHLWQRHISDSAQLLAVPRETIPDGTWLDLGTGAGFPGLVIAAIQPQRRVVLVDSRRLRTVWLERTALALELDNVEVRHARVQDLDPCDAAVISARAFAPLPKLLAFSARFSSPKTLWLLPKGASAAHELEMLPKTWNHAFHVEQSLTDDSAGIIAGRLLGGPGMGYSR